MNEQANERNHSIDILRGAVMVLMALDHVRYFITDVQFLPEDLQRTWMALFLTRWITHFCAPLFFFLAGMSAYLSANRKLWLRGLWLIALELTIIGFAWSFVPGSSFAGVIWCLGWSMIALSILARLPVSVSAVFGMVMIAGHNLLDGVQSDHWLWHFLHVSGNVTLPGGVHYFVLYPLVPWVGVMALGYAFGSWLRLPIAQRSRRFFIVGAIATATFIVLRITNAYGNPSDFHVQATIEKTIIAFLNTEKYPASLQYVLMTLGPALMIFAWLDRGGIRLPVLETFGRAPLFFYVMHLYLIHALALVLPRGNLAYVWFVTLAVVALLYVPSRWRSRIFEGRAPSSRVRLLAKWL